MCVNIFGKKKKKILPCTVWSTVSYTFDRRHGPTFELTYVCSSIETHFTHTLSMNAIERMYVRSIACVLSPHVTFLGQFLPFFPSFHWCAILSLFLSSHITPNHHPTAQTLPQNHNCTFAPPPITTVGLSITPFLYFSISSLFPHKPNLSQKFSFCPIFERPKGQSIHGLCPFDWCVGLVCRRVLKPSVLEVPTKYLIKGPNEFPACLEGELHLLGPLTPMP